MILIAILSLLVQAHAHTTQPTCTSITLRIPGVQKISHDGVGESLSRLSYRFDFCEGQDDVIQFISTDTKTGDEVSREAFRGKIESIYQPANVEDFTFRNLPSRISLVPSRDYALNGKIVHNELGELHFHDGRDLHMISAHRNTRENDFRAPVRKKGEKAEVMAPFSTFEIVLPIPKSSGFTVVKAKGARLFGQHYQLVTVKTPEGFERTFLVENESKAQVGLVQAFVADMDGNLTIDPPQADGDFIVFPEFDFSVHAPSFRAESMIPPLSKQEWLEAQTQADTTLRTSFIGRTRDVGFKRTRELLERPIDRELKLSEWMNLLTDPELRLLMTDKRRAHAQGKAVVKDILLSAYPQLSRLPRVEEAIDDFSDAIATLLVGGTLIEPQLRRVLGTHLEASASEAHSANELSCAEMLKGFAGRAAQRGLPLELDQAVRKASFNLDILRAAIQRSRR